MKTGQWHCHDPGWSLLVGRISASRAGAASPRHRWPAAELPPRCPAAFRCKVDGENADPPVAAMSGRENRCWRARLLPLCCWQSAPAARRRVWFSFSLSISISSTGSTCGASLSWMNRMPDSLSLDGSCSRAVEAPLRPSSATKHAGDRHSHLLGHAATLRGGQLQEQQSAAVNAFIDIVPIRAAVRNVAGCGSSGLGGNACIVRVCV